MTLPLQQFLSVLVVFCDGLTDACEIENRLDPYRADTGVFQTTNALTFAAYLGTNRVHGPCVVADRVWTHDFGHCVATSGEKASVSVWDETRTITGNVTWARPATGT